MHEALEKDISFRAMPDTVQGLTKSREAIQGKMPNFLLEAFQSSIFSWMELPDAPHRIALQTIASLLWTVDAITSLYPVISVW